ncbi:MAG: nickel pincer cofactor biosynthesis protein LarC [Coriobacteriia bacterium]|nr:nickel pincer cofactor biosynthesis protein LarC [Coriobacteriia bacterium]MCL2137715.1 nickel pincer cofactor biosynthesis protein LarC [Coriobacteriia bacterium]
MLEAPSPTRILHFDFSTGASGDKVLGALLEACESLGVAGLADLQKLASALGSSISIHREKTLQGAISATSIRVSEAEPPHRHWFDIQKMIAAAAASGALSESASRLAISTFESIALVEAAVHNEDLDHVHFHEVGAADSIVDIVGSCYLFDLLRPCVVFASPLVLGFGTFKSSHGEMSVPAPATSRLIQGLSVMTGPYEGEMTTPTGAALAKAFVDHWQPFAAMRPTALGYGAGTREVKGASNTVRLLVGESLPAVGPGPGLSSLPVSVPQTGFSPLDTSLETGTDGTAFYLENVVLMEANIDHRTPEALAFAAEELLAHGALDVWQEAVMMKKGRLATKLSLLCVPAKSSESYELMLGLTGSLGVRMRMVERVVVGRESISLETKWGPVGFKLGRFVTDGDPPNDTRWIRPEHDDVARIAREFGLDYHEVYDDLCRIADLQALIHINKHLPA